MSTYYDDPERLSAFNEAKLNYERKLAGDKAFQAPLPTANERADDVIARHAQAQKGSEVYNTMPFDEKEETNALLGTFAAVGVELGTGIGATYALKRGQTAVKALRAVRAASIVGAAAPEPISTGLGVIGFAASEAAIWGFSNFLGQSTRVAFGIQEGISGGEMIASSIFGVGVTSNFANKIFKVDKALKEGEKLFKLGDSVGAMNAWKSMNGTINNSRTFLSGASLGLAETFVRQELEQLMNDDANRNAYEYLFAGAMGGTFNSVLTAWGNKGAWGMGQAVKLADNSIRAVDTHILDLRTKIESKGGKRTGKLNRQLNEALQSKEILEDFQRSIVGASDIDAKIKAKSEADTEPLEITPEKLTEEANTKIEEIKKEAAELESPEIYHVTLNENVESITNSGLISGGGENFKGIDPSHPNYKKITSEGKIGGVSKEGSFGGVHAFETLEDAEKWAMQMNWELTGDLMGGAVSIVKVRRKGEWVDDPKSANMQQVKGAKGKVLVKKEGDVSPEDILGVSGSKTEDAPKPKVIEDIPNEQWLKDKVEDVIDRGTNSSGSPSLGSITGSFKDGEPLKLELDVTKNVDGYNGEHLRLDQAKVDGLAAELVRDGKFETAPLIGIAHNGKPYILEGNHRIAASQKAGIPIDIEVRYFDGGQRNAINGWKPDELKINKKPKVEEELPPVEEGLPPVEGEKVPVTKSPLDQAREQLDAEESTLNLSIDQTAESALIKKYEDMDINKDNVSTSIPMIEKDLKPIVYRATAEVNSDIRFIADAYNNNGGLPALDIQVETLTRLKNNMFLLSRAQRLTDLAETTGGRAIQAADPNSFEGKYDEYTTKYSFRAVAQQIAYAKFSNSLDDMLDGGSGGSVVRLFDEYMAVPEQYGNSGAFKFGRDLPDEEVNDMAWQDVKELVRTYNSNLPEGGERIKLSGKGVTQATVKEQIKAGRKEVRSANELAGRLRKTVKTLETKLERIRSVVFNDGAKLYDEAGEPLVDKYGTPLPSVGVDSAVANAARKAFNEDPEIQDLNTAVKYYRDLIDETDKITAAEKELAEVARIEGGGILTEIQNKIMKANNIAVPADGRWVSDAAGGATSKESLLEELKRKIAESKKRSRDKVNDVKRAQDQIDKRDFFTNYENTLSANIDVATAGIFTKGLQTANSWRKMNLINQLPSVLAGVPTAMYAIGREGLAQPAASFIRAVTKGKDVSVATELAMDRFTGFWGAFFTNDGLMETARRSFKDGGDPTSGSASKFAEDFKGRMTLEGSIGRAKRRAVSAAESKEALDATTATAYSLGKLNQLFSIGVRGIGTLDAVTKRQLVQGTLMGKAKENARLSLRAVNPAATEDEIAAEASKIYKSLWKDDNGLAVLGELGEYDYAVDEINNSILMARQNIPDDVIHKDMGEQLIKGVRNFAGTGTGLELIVDMFMPYVAVPIRGAYKGLTITAAPLGLMKGQWHNPYDVKIKKLTEERFANERVISEYKAKTTTNPAEEAFNKNVIETNQATIDNTTRKLKALDRYSNDYAQEKLVDTLVGGGLFMAGLVGGMQGAMTGSLNWMTADQREKNKLKPFTGMGMDYRAAAPMAIPMAIGADIAHYIRLKRSGQLLENQNMFMLAASTMVQLTQEVPLFQGMKSLTTLATAGQDAKINELTKLAGSYFPIPAQIDKLIQGVAVAGGDKTIADLKGGNWSDRMLYAAIGIKPINRQTDRFGEDIEGDATFLTTTVSRQLPKFGAGELKTDFERLLATDKFNQIGDKPTTFNGAKMHSFVDEEGMTLAYAFSQELKTTRLRVDGGSNLTLKEAVAKLTNRKAWQKKYNAEFLSFTDTKQVYNEGIQEVDLLMNRYYNELKKKLAADQRFIGRFIDSSGESLTNRLSLEEAPRNILSTLR